MPLANTSADHDNGASTSISPRIGFLDESLVTRDGLFLTRYEFGPRITPQGNCLKVYKGYIFVTWYRGGMEDRHVMLSRCRVGDNNAWHHIEFPHQHVMFKRDITKGDSHNIIAVGISPKDDSIHLLYDMHAYTPKDLPHDYFNYSRSKPGAAIASDYKWKIDLFLPKQGCLRKDQKCFRVTYPAFKTTPDGDLLVDWRTGGDKGAKMHFTKYNGYGEWAKTQEFNSWNDGDESYGFYGEFKFQNGSLQTAFSRRTKADQSDGYINNRGLYYGRCDQSSGTGTWHTLNGAAIKTPITDIAPFKIAEPSKPGDRLSCAPDFAQSQYGALHFLVGVHGKIQHYYKTSSDKHLSNAQVQFNGTLFAIGCTMYVVGLENGRPIFRSTPAGTNNWTVIYRHKCKMSFKFGKIAVDEDGKQLFFFLMEDKRGDRQPLRVLRFSFN